MYEPIRQRLKPFRPKGLAYLLHARDSVPGFTRLPSAAGKLPAVATERIDAGVDTVIFSDVSGFYENIDLNRLKHFLRAANVQTFLIDQLFTCLWAWAEPRGRGIPQGMSASDLLAKLYLDGVDHRLERAGFERLYMSLIQISAIAN